MQNKTNSHLENDNKAKPSSMVEEGKFTELEKSRMENPPKHREDNGMDKEEVDEVKDLDQSGGV